MLAVDRAVLTGGFVPLVVVVQLFGDLHGVAADTAIVSIGMLGKAVFGVGVVFDAQGKRRFIAVFLGVGVLVFALDKHRGQHLAARIGGVGHGKGKGCVRVYIAVAGLPAAEHPALVRLGGHGLGHAALAHQLAGFARQHAAALHDKLQGNFGVPHGDGVLFDQVDRHAHGLGDAAQRLGTAILGDIGVGAHILKQRSDGGFGKMHAVRQGVVFFCPPGGGILQHLGGVQKFKVVVLAHFFNGGVVGVHLHHLQAGVAALLVQRGNGADNDIAVRPSLADGVQPLQIGGNKGRSIGGSAAQVVGAVADDDALRLEHRHGFGYGVHLGRAGELLTFQRGDGARSHADNADVVVRGGKCLAGIVGVQKIARGVGVADKQGFIHIAAPGVGGFGQDGADLGGVGHNRDGCRGRAAVFAGGCCRRPGSGGQGRGVFFGSGDNDSHCNGDSDDHSGCRGDQNCKLPPRQRRQKR